MISDPQLPLKVCTDLDDLRSRYDIVLADVVIGRQRFGIHVVRDTNALVDRISPEEFARDERLPFWAELWTSSLELARHCLYDAGLEGARVLELGCGVGLAGIACALAGADVTMSDYETDALAFARVNASFNLSPRTVEQRVRFASLDWRCPDISETFDAIIGADIVYEREMFMPLLATFRKALRPGAAAIITEPDRSVGRDFLTTAAAEGFATHTVRTNTERAGRITAVTRSTLKWLE